MSTITPLLDTLLHQVLGRRMDGPAPTPLNQPVTPLVPGQAVEALGRDERPPLTPRSTTPKSPGVAETGARDAAKAGERAPLPAPASTPGTAPVSARTHFSGAARAIADLLIRYPAPPSAVRPAEPLLPGPPLSTAPLAAALRGSVEHSGLFYESHLGEWFRGERPLAALRSEPQMRVATMAASVAAGPATATAPATTPAPVSVRGQEGMVNAGGREAEGEPRAAVAGGHRGPTGVEESVQPVVRHQLELLATPVLRWEGDLWSGLFAALLIQAPPRESRPDGDPENPGRSGEEEGAWLSQLEVRTEALGEIRVQLRLHGGHLNLELAAPREQTLARLREGQPVLRDRLEALGLQATIKVVNRDPE
ncbi:flagellar hook-length control protein FliK [Alloalcanivorax xenomutans]|uniref:flagellar hook-length control protein FliK n=1 Tax=Alloalcanivorax xenomutans TaxID=1094342 RepID=UPI003BA9640D